MGPAEPTHYEVLGVAAGASAAEIRRAYLALARRHHPDFHPAADEPGRRADEREMQRINQAWAVLGDPGRRAAYDRGLEADDEPARRRPGPADYRFTPLDDDDTDYAALLDDTPVEGTQVSRWLQTLPPALLVGGFVALVVGAVVNVGLLLALGVAGLVLGLLAFLATPFVAVMRSYQSDPDR